MAARGDNLILDLPQPRTYEQNEVFNDFPLEIAVLQQTGDSITAEYSSLWQIPPSPATPRFKAPLATAIFCAVGGTYMLNAQVKGLPAYSQSAVNGFFSWQVYDKDTDSLTQLTYPVPTHEGCQATTMWAPHYGAHGSQPELYLFYNYNPTISNVGQPPTGTPFYIWNASAFVLRIA